MSNMYGSSSSSQDLPIQGAFVGQEPPMEVPDFTIVSGPGPLFPIDGRGMCVNITTGQLFFVQSPGLVFPQPLYMYDNVVYDMSNHVVPPEMFYGPPKPAPVPLFVPPPTTPSTKPLIPGTPRTAIVVSRPPAPSPVPLAKSSPVVEGISPSLDRGSSSWEAQDDDVIEALSDMTVEELPSEFTFGVMDYQAMHRKCAEFLALALKETIQASHVSLSSDRSSTCTVFYNNAIYVIDTYSGLVFNTLPSDFNLVGRIVLPRERIGNVVNGRLGPSDKIIVSHILNARDDCFEINDEAVAQLPSGEKVRYASFHYTKLSKTRPREDTREEKRTLFVRGTVPEGRSYTVRGTIVDLDVGVAICNSFGWTPVCEKSVLEPNKEGILTLQSKNEDGIIVNNVFNIKDLDTSPEMKDGDNSNGVIIKPFIEGTLLRVVLSYGEMLVVSHSRINLEKSKYNGSDSFLKLFQRYGLTRDVLFPGSKEGRFVHSNFHYNFILRDSALLSSSRTPVGAGSLAYVGTMYNYNSDPEFCPYEDVPIFTTPVKFNVGSRIGIYNIPVTDVAANKRQDALTIFVPKTMTIADANKHLAREFLSPEQNAEGSVIIMQKDSSNMYTNIVRVIHTNAAARMKFIEGDTEMEGFLKHIPDATIPSYAFRNKYGNLAGLLFPRDSLGHRLKIYLALLATKMTNNVLTDSGVLHEHRSLRLYSYSADPDFNTRLCIIATTFVSCLPPGRQMKNYGILSEYIDFVNTGNEVFRRERRLIEENGDRKGAKLYSLNEKLKYRNNRRQGKTTRGNAVSVVSSSKDIDFRKLSAEDLVFYYKGFAKIRKIKEYMEKSTDGSSSSSAPLPQSRPPPQKPAKKSSSSKKNTKSFIPKK